MKEEKLLVHEKLYKQLVQEHLKMKRRKEREYLVYPPDFNRNLEVTLRSKVKLNLELLELQNLGLHTDIIINCENGFFEVHSVILMASSPMFFTFREQYDQSCEMKEEDGPPIMTDVNLKQFRFQDVATVLFLFYTGQSMINMPGMLSDSSECQKDIVTEILEQMGANSSDVLAGFPLGYDETLVSRQLSSFQEQKLRFGIRSSSPVEPPLRYSFLSVDGKIQNGPLVEVGSKNTTMEFTSTSTSASASPSYNRNNMNDNLLKVFPKLTGGESKSATSRTSTCSEQEVEIESPLVLVNFQSDKRADLSFPVLTKEACNIAASAVEAQGDPLNLVDADVNLEEDAAQNVGALRESYPCPGVNLGYACTRTFKRKVTARVHWDHLWCKLNPERTRKSPSTSTLPKFPVASTSRKVVLRSSNTDVNKTLTTKSYSSPRLSATAAARKPYDVNKGLFASLKNKYRRMSGNHEDS